MAKKPANGPLPDVVADGLSILFVGYNPGLRSGAVGHHFAGPSNRFWKLLAESGLTPRRYRTEEDRDLPSLGYGITNIVPRVTRAAAEITKEEFLRGRKRLLALIRKHRPRIVCYEGIGVYREFALTKEVPWGLQETSVVPGVLDFVVPSPSGLCRVPYAEQLHWLLVLKGLKEDVERKSQSE